MAEGEASRRVKTDEAAAATPASDSSSSGVAASLVKPAGSGVDAGATTGADDGGSEADADGEEIDDDSPMQLSAPTNGDIKPATIGSALISKANSMRHVPLVGGEGELPEVSRDVFLSTSIDGQVMIWDRRIKSGAKGGVRRLACGGKDGNWAASVGRLLALHPRTDCLTSRANHRPHGRQTEIESS